MSSSMVNYLKGFSMTATKGKQQNMSPKAKQQKATSDNKDKVGKTEKLLDKLVSGKINGIDYNRKFALLTKGMQKHFLVEGQTK